MSTADREVLDAAAALLDAFARHDTAAYFACFAPDATFLFHTADGLLPNRAAYEAEWAAWEADGFAVLGCTSSDQAVSQVSDTVAVFTHAVRTRVRSGGAEEDLDERESIVFRREDDGSWLGVHEHLSARS